MSEAKEGCAFLEDTDEHTFLRFSQYAFTGDYTTANPEILSDAPSIPTTPTSNNPFPDSVNGVSEPSFFPETVALTEFANDPRDLPYRPFFKYDKKKGKMLKPGWPIPVLPVLSKKSTLWDTFKSQKYPISKPLFQVWEKHEVYESYTEVFLDHARLYVFAEKYDIDPLRSLSLQKLHRILVDSDTGNALVKEGILDLIQYSYSNTVDPPGSTDPLRLLVISYAACVIEDLAKTPDFHSRLEESGSAATDLVVQMLQRLD